MNLTLRRCIFVLFIFLFLTLSPIILLYNTGYRYDFQKGKMVKTGILVVKMIPSDAQIFLNNEPAQWQKDNNGFRITNLLPREYSIRIEKQGYFPWEKKLPILNKTTTFASNIVLFPHNTPTLILEGEIQPLDVRGDKALFLAGETLKAPPRLFLLNLKNHAIQELPVLPVTPSVLTQATPFIGLTSSNPTLVEATFSPNAERVLVGIGVPREEDSPQDYFVFDTKNPNRIIALSDIIPHKKFETMQWDITSNYLLYGLPQNFAFEPDDFYQINLLTKEWRSVTNPLQEPNTSAAIKSFIVSDNEIFAIRQNTDGIALDVIPTSKESSQTKRLLQLPSNVLLSFLDPRNGFPHLVEHTKGTISLFDKEQSQFIVTLHGQDAKEKEKQWLFSNNFELWTWNQESKDATLISRYSQPIQEILWHPHAPYTLFSFKDAIQIIELDPRDRRNQYTLTAMEKISNLIVDSDGKQIFFIGKAGDEQGLYVQDIATRE